MNGVDGPNARTAANTGGRLFLLGYATGLLMAAAFLFFMSGTTPNVLFRMIGEWPLQTLVCFTVGPLISLALGRWGGVQVAIRNRSPWILVPVLSYVSVWLTLLPLGLISFLQDGVGNEPILTRVQAYTVKPLFLVTVFGFPFIIVVSLLIAYRFQRIFRFGGGVGEKGENPRHR